MIRRLTDLELMPIQEWQYKRLVAAGSRTLYKGRKHMEAIYEQSQDKKVRLSATEKLSYGIGDCGANVIVALASSFLTGYYTDTVGVAAAAIGTMMLLCRVFDGITDLIMGALVDKTKSKYGKARPWLLWTAPLMGISLFLIFNVPASLGATGKLIYIYLTYIFQNCIIYTANNLPYNALLSRMTLDVQDRAQTASIRFVMTQVTSLITNVITANLIASVGWRSISAIYGTVACVMCVLCFLGVREHVDAEDDGTVKVERVPLSKALPALFKNKYFFIQALMFMFLYINVVTTGSMTYYFCNSVLGNIAFLSWTSVAGTVPAMIVNLMMPGLVAKFGKRKLMITGATIMAIGSCIIGAAGSNLPLVVLGLIVKGFGTGPIMSGIFATTADVVDYGEWKTGVRSEGLVNSCTSFGMKVGIGLGSAICTWIIAIGGYVGTAEVQTESALASIRFGYGYFGAILSLVVLALCIIMNIDKHIDQIQRDLEAKRSMA